MVCKVFRYSGKCSDCLKVTGWSAKHPDDLGSICDDMKSVRIIYKASGWSEKCPDYMQSVHMSEKCQLI